MPNSKRFLSLSKRLKELRKNMLPVSFNATGDYSAKVQDRARGFRLLAHSEMESYLEDISRALLLFSLKKWKEKKRASLVLFSLLTSYHSSWGKGDPKAIIELAKQRDQNCIRNKSNSGEIEEISIGVEKILNSATMQFHNILSSNHGIRISNLCNVLIPIGIDIAELDDTWLMLMDEFGKKRGEIAHNAKKITDSINPSDEYNTIVGLLDGLKKLDEKILLLEKGKKDF